jgi:prepilin-type N-terminal cleavage/methylation domain-containing protein
MYKWLVKNLKKDNRGFTLIELALVIAILGILAGIAVPKYTSSKVSAAVAAHNANIKTLESAASMYLVDDGTDTTWTGAATGESWNNYLQEWPGIPKGLTKNDGTTKIEPSSATYKVTISDGQIVVIPGKADDKGKVSTDPSGK